MGQNNLIVLYQLKYKCVFWYILVEKYEVAYFIMRRDLMINVMIGNHDETMRKKTEDIVRRQTQCNLLGTYETGDELLNHIKEKVPDLVILNPVMPKLDGIGVIENVRLDTSFDHVRFVLVAGQNQTKILNILQNRKNVCFLPWENDENSLEKCITEIPFKNQKNVAALPIEELIVKQTNQEKDLN